jgi:hypothetical protein
VSDAPLPPETAPAPHGLDPRAIALGAGATLAIGLSSTFLVQSVLVGDTAPDVELWRLLSTVVGLFADAIGGATAGFIARRRGAVHGVLASLLAAIGGLLVTAVMLGRQGHIELLGDVAFLAQWLLWTALGAVLAAAAGAFAARVAAVAKR